MNVIALVVLSVCAASPVWANIYCVNNVIGNDVNPGIALIGKDCSACLDSAVAPWNTLNKVNNTFLQPGDRICLAANNVWHEQLIISFSGNANAPIIYDEYGSGALPQIDAGDTVDNSVVITNQSYVRINNLAVIVSQQLLGSAIFVSGGHDIEVSRVKLTNLRKLKSDPLQVYDSNFFKLDQSEIQGGFHGIHILGNNHQGFIFTVTNNYIHDIDAGNQADWDGIKCGGGGTIGIDFSGSLIAGNRITRFGEDGIDVKFCGGNFTIKNNIIYKPNDKYVTNPNINAIKLPDENQPGRITVESNQFFYIGNISGVGTCVTGGKNKQHQIVNNLCYSPAMYGFYIDSWDGANVSNNQVTGAKYAIKVVDSFDNGTNITLFNNILAGSLQDLRIKGANVTVTGDNNSFIQQGVVTFEKPFGGKYVSGGHDLFLKTP